ncbi:MAG: hypothetical protein H6510_17670 [Acidobacteria bacterium]|nr:hypothetical protein [Acidobacteriota bacterium]MCB9399645.1 hypothetical protein [Acidobacteriota bacterium]
MHALCIFAFFGNPITHLQFRMESAAQPGALAKVEYMDFYAGNQLIRIDYGLDITKLLDINKGLVTLIEHNYKVYWQEPDQESTDSTLHFEGSENQQTVLDRPCPTYQTTWVEEGETYTIRMAFFADETFRNTAVLDQLIGMDLETATFQPARPQGVPAFVEIRDGQGKAVLKFELVAFEQVEKSADFFEPPKNYENKKLM